MSECVKVIGPIIGMVVWPVKTVRTGKIVPDNYNPGPAKGARWDDPCEPYNRGKEVKKCVK